MVKAIIFDLDNCLSAADEPGLMLLEPMFAAIRRANKGTVSDPALEQAFAECWRHSLDWVTARHHFSPEMLAAAWETGARIEVKGPMSGYADLPELKKLDAKLFLVTSGFRRLQESKIKALGIRPLFEAVYVDAVDDAHRKGKQRIFEEILRNYAFSPREVLVVGDNADSEIKAGNSLGMRTVQILREGVPHSNTAKDHIHGLSELKRLL